MIPMSKYDLKRNFTQLMATELNKDHKHTLQKSANNLSMVRVI